MNKTNTTMKNLKKSIIENNLFENLFKIMDILFTNNEILSKRLYQNRYNIDLNLEKIIKNLRATKDIINEFDEENEKGFFRKIFKISSNDSFGSVFEKKYNFSKKYETFYNFLKTDDNNILET
jgi:hypothetical protein